MKTVIFDLDGTLADTSGDLIAAANHCFRAAGHGDMLDPALDKGTALKGGRAMLRLGFGRLHGTADEAEVDRWYVPLLEAYGENIDTHTRLYPGAEENITKLLDRGYFVGICTNKPERLAEELMSRLGVRDLFGSLVGADTLPVRKPDAAPYVAAVTRAGGQVASSLLVGDTDTDRSTARAAGVPSLLVTFGPDGNDVSALRPEGLLESYDLLQVRVQELIG
ncbi:HAD hydrolase-like protein [Roseovarius sp.]|uniref:HAD hydrolase-like protein n=1 Tax=Roseovarius sp. TaxID=1486281 RepID=UPI00260718E4|nr:HAD hydrolase-like protein [Roseovarius sp.]